MMKLHIQHANIKKAIFLKLRLHLVKIIQVIHTSDKASQCDDGTSVFLIIAFATCRNWLLHVDEGRIGNNVSFYLARQFKLGGVPTESVTNTGCIGFLRVIKWI